MMSRQGVMVIVLLLFVGGVAWYATSSVPTMSFAEASKGGEEKKGIVSGTVIEASATANEAGGIGFTMRDAAGTVSPVTYTGSDPLDSLALGEAHRTGRTVKITGHSHGTWFHATAITFP